MAAHDLDRILSDGEWLAHRYDEVANAFHMRAVSRAEHRSATFLTDEYLGIEPHPVLIDLPLATQSPIGGGELHFLFHSAFCASTLLARGFDLPNVSMGLKEPVLLNDIVGLRRRGAAPAMVAKVLDHGLRMLARPLGADKAVIVKPSNVFNSLASVSLALRPASKAIFLYAPLPVFLTSVALKGLWCRLWCRELLDGLVTDGIVDFGFEPRDYFLQSDLQIAAIGWLAQHRLFQGLVEKYGAERLATLDSEVLTSDPGAALSAVAAHFGLDVRMAQISGHSAFSTHSKFGGQFTTSDRRSEHEAARSAYAEEIDHVLKWVDAVAKSAGMNLEQPNPLRF